MINWEEEKKKAKSLDTKDKYNRLIYSAGENNKNSVDELYRLTNPAQASKWQDYSVGTDRLKEKLYNHAAAVEFENYLSSNNIDADKLAAQSSALKLRSSLNDVTDTYNSVRDGKTLSEKEAKQYQKAVKNARELYNANKGSFSEEEISQIDNSFNAFDALSDEYANYYSIYENTDAYKALSDKSKEKYWKEQKKKAKKELRQAKLNDFENILAEAAASNPIVSDEFKSQLIENKKQSGREIDAKRDAYYNIKARENYYNAQDVMERVNIIDTNNDLKMLVDGIYSANKSIEIAENSTSQPYDNNAQNLNNQYQNELNKTILSSQQIVESNTKKINDLGYNADELIEAYTAYKDGLAADEQEQQITDFAKSHPYLATFAGWGITAATAPGSLSRYVDTAAETATGNNKKQVVFEDGQAVGVETGVQSPATQARDTLRSGVSDLISQSSSGKLGQITYDIVNSGVDSAINMAVGSITGTGLTEIMNTGKNAAEIAKNTKNIVSATTSLIMGSQVGAEKMIEAKQNGDSDIQALALGALYATATIVSEKYSLDEILKSTDKSWIKSLAKGAAAEGSEEIVENILDRIADVVIEGDNAEIAQQYYAYMQNGYSAAEATGKVFANVLGEDALAFVGGAVSGAVMKGIGSVAVPNQYEAIGTDVKSDNQVQQEINTGLAMPKDSKAFKLAVELQDTLNSKTLGEKATEDVNYNNLSSKKIGKLNYYNTIETEKNRFSNAVSHENNAQALQKSFDKLINAKAITSKDVQNFANSEAALDYINDSYGTNYNLKNISAHSLNELARAFEADALVGAPKIRFGKLVDKNYNSLSLNATDNNGNNVTIESVEYASPKGSTITFNTTDGNVLANDEINFTPAQNAVVNEISQAKVGKNGVATIMSYAPENTNVDEAQIYADNSVALYDVAKTSNDTIDTLLKNKTVAGIAEYLVERTENENAARDIIASAREDLTQTAVTAYVEQKNIENIEATGTDVSEELNKAITSKSKEVQYVGDVQKKLSKKQKNQLSIFSKLVQGKGATAVNIVVADKSTANVIDESGNAVVANALQTGESIVLFADAETDMLMAYGGHELTHYLEKFADAKLYTNYHNFVMDYLHSKWNENTYNANVNEYARAYGFDKDTEMYQIEREMVADNGMAVFSDEEALKTLAGENRTLLQKILDFFNEFIGRLDNALRGLAKTSVVYNEVKADRQFLLESAKQIKAMLDSVENNTATENNVDFSKNTDFSYNELIKKPNMNITQIDDSIEYKADAQTRKNVVNAAIENAKKVGRVNENGNPVVYVDDIKTGVIVSKRAIRHSLDRRLKINAPVVANVGSILKNSIKVNELINRNDNIEKSYVLIGVAKNSNNEPYVVSFVINNYTNAIQSMDVLYSVNAKTEPAGSLSPKVSTLSTDSDISISNLLDYVNKYFPDILPNEVLKHYGYDNRPKGTLGENVLYSKNTTLDSAGNKLTKEQAEYFKDSKVRDENGNLLVVYHGSNADFTVFDKTKGRANMDIQGSFFSPWELDASGYGSNVKAYYLNITNPADEQTGYRALKKYQGQNNAGVKAREYLESLGYDGVNNENEEYIAFNSNQIKLVENAVPTNKSDIRYSKTTNFAKALTAAEWKKYNKLIATDDKSALKISDKAYMVEGENGEHNYKVVFYDNSFEEKPITAIYGIGNNEFHKDIGKFDARNVAEIINKIEEEQYADEKIIRGILQDVSNGYGFVLRRYSIGNTKAINIRPKSVPNGRTNKVETDRERNAGENTEGISNSNNYSRNTYTRATVGLEDSNEILEQGLKMLAGIKNIDFNSNIVDLVGKANANLNKQGMADFKASKMYNKNSVNDIAKQLKSEYASTARTGYIRQMLTDLYDYMANSTEQDLDYMNSQAKVIARELISTSTHVVESDYNELHDYVGAKPFSVSEEIKQSFAKEYGSWSEAKAAVIPNLKVRNNAISLSQYYNDLAKEFPGISAGEFSNVFDESVVDEREMLERLGAFYYATQPTVTNNFQEQIESNGSINGKYTLDEFENIVANDIFDKFFSVEQVANAIDTLAQEQKNAIDEIKDKFESEKHALIERYKQRELNLKEHNKLVNQRARERRNATGIRAKIVKIKNDFDKMLNHPTQSRHIPRALVQEVAQICDIITDSQYYNKNGRERSQNVIITLDRLKTKYDSIKNDSDYIVENAYDSNIADYITQLADRFNGKQLSDMTSAELQEVYEVLRAIQKTVSNANKLIKSQVKLDAHKAAVEFMLENNKTKGRQLADKEKGINVRGGVNGAVSAFDSDFMNPMRYVNLMVEGNHNSVLYGLFDDLNRGARAKDKYIMEFSKPFDALIADKRYKSYKEKKVDTGINVNGMPVMLTEDQIAQILLTAQRKQGVTHLQGGGFVALNTNYMQKGNMAKAKINGTVVPALQIDTINYFASLYNSLSDYGKKWVDSARYFFTTQSKPIINETSFELKGYKIAGDDNYIPIAVDKNYTNQEIEGVILDKTLENSGFTKSTVPNASNRIIISGLSNVISKHINDVAKYAGLAIPIHNFNKVWKGQTSSVYDRQAISELGGHRLSVRDAVQRKWGDQAVRVIEKTVKDLQTERISEISEIDRLYNKLLSGSINAVFTGNISIVLKQAASYPTAVAVLDSDCLAKGIKGFAQTESLYSEIDQHTATHYKRRLGLSTQELGELAKVKRNQGKQFSKLSPTKWIQLMDVQTTAALWLACKAQVVKDNKGIDINSGQYWAKVTELYDYVVETTQPNYDIMHRPEIQKSNGAISKTLSLFQTQPLQNAGILYDSIRNLNWKKEALKNDSNTKTLAEYKQAQGQAVKAIWSQVSSAMVFSAMSTFVRFLLHNLKKYRDEDDEVKAKKVLEVWTSEAVQTLLGVAMPVIGSISYDIGNRLLTLVQTGKATTQFDFIQNMGMSAINDFIGDAYNVFKSSVNVAQGTSDAKDLANDIYILSSDVASFFGIPVKNVENILKSAWAYGNEAFSSDYRLFEYGVDTTKAQYISRAYKAIENGDKQAYQNAYNKLIQNGYTDNEIHAGIKSELIKNNSQIAQAGVFYLDGEIDNMFSIVEQLKMAGYDERDIIQAIKGYKDKIVEAKKALVDGDQEGYESKLNELMQSGIDKDTIVNAINSVEVEEENSATVKQIYSTDDVIAAINDGDTKHAKSMIDSMVQITVDNGKDENSAKKDIKSKIATAFRTDYVTATAAERKSIEKELSATGLFEASDYKEWISSAYDSDGVYGTDAMQKAFEGGLTTTREYINAKVAAKVNAGQDEDKAKSNIKSQIAKMYKEKYVNGNADTRASILNIMTNTGLYGSKYDAKNYADKNWLK